MTRKQLWRKSPEFRKLCDLVASDRLVVITGAGISSQLRQKSNPAKKLPQWWDLLKALFVDFGPRLVAEDRKDCERLLQIGSYLPKRKTPSPTGKELILAASILRQVDRIKFDDRFRRKITPKPGSFSETHAAICELQPMGVLTFNYDDAHESAWRVYAPNLRLKAILPHNESKLRDTLTSGARPFYIKAHGSISSSKELVLTVESYRQLIVKSPAYRAFVQDILTNRHILFVGFGMSDPDFDLFVETMALQFGSPIHDHIVIRHRSSRNVDDVSLRRRFGIHSLYVSEFTDIPEILRDSLMQTGPKLTSTLSDCLSTNRKKRDLSHLQFQALGPAGKQCATNVLKSKISKFELRHQYFELSEVAYSLGQIDARKNKDTLMSIVEHAKHADPAGRALTVLRPVLTLSDVPTLESWKRRFSGSPLPGEYSDRIIAYLDYLLVYLPSKYRS